METAAAWAELLSMGEIPDEDFDDDRAAELVSMIQNRGEPMVVDWALPMLADPDPWHRQAAAWVLGQHGVHLGRPFGGRVLPALIEAARQELDDETRAYLIGAIGHSEDRSAAEVLMSYADDGDPDVRQAVASQLPFLFKDDDYSQTAIDTIIALMADEDSAVRDWATFSLGTIMTVDGVVVRQALWLRTEDEEPVVREEAVKGLARRRQIRVVPLVAALLEDRDVGDFLIEAAAFLADPRLIAPLERLHRESALVADALLECDPIRRKRRDTFAEEVLDILRSDTSEFHTRLVGHRFQTGLTIEAVDTTRDDTFSWSIAGLIKRSDANAVLAADLMEGDLRSADPSG